MPKSSAYYFHFLQFENKSTRDVHEITVEISHASDGLVLDKKQDITKRT